MSANPVPVPKELPRHEIGPEGETVLFDADGSQLLVLNDIGAGVWLLLDGERGLADIVDEILEVHPATRDAVERDVRAFLDDLVERGLVTWRD